MLFTRNMYSFIYLSTEKCRGVKICGAAWRLGPTVYFSAVAKFAVVDEEVGTDTLIKKKVTEKDTYCDWWVEVNLLDVQVLDLCQTPR